MKTAVIASNSFTGAAIVDHFLNHTDHEIVGISRSAEYDPIFLPYLYKKQRPQRFSFFKLDINTELPKVIEVLNGARPEIVINLAAQGEVSNSWKSPVDWFQTNAVGVVGLVDGIARGEYVQRFVQISTPEVYGSSHYRAEDPCFYDPSSPYAASKAAGDLFLNCMAKVKGFPVTTIRSTNVYGIHQQLYRIIPRTIISAKSGKKLELQGGGKAVKSYLHVRDVARAVLLSVTKGSANEMYHLGPEGEGISIRDLVTLVAERMGKRLSDVALDAPDRAGQDAAYVLNWEKAQRELGWIPQVSLEHGISEMVEWIENEWDQIKTEPLNYVHKL